MPNDDEFEDRDNNWIQTFTGRKFWPLDPLPEDVYIEDIAHALSMMCRFAGHTHEFYSVAQHSVEVSYLCPNYPLYGLLHDAAEAYMIDLAQPIKRGLREKGITIFDSIEEKLMDTIWASFGKAGYVEGGLIDKEVRQADRIMLATEAREFMAPLLADWKIEPKYGLNKRLISLSPMESKELFLIRFKELTNG